MQRMVEVHIGMMQVLTQDMVNRDSKDLPPGMQQVLDDYSRIVQMMSQILVNTNHSPPQNDHGSKEPRDDTEMTLRACKVCGEIGHTSKQCCEQCPYCDTSHPIGECLMAQVTCFLCDGINHVPIECYLYPMVQQMKQQAKDGLCQLLEKTQEDRRSKMKVDMKVMEIAHDITTKCYFSCEEEGHLSRNCSRKRERFPTAIVEYEEPELRDLLALERPKKKKDNSKVLCFNCKELGHYADKCPERDNKANRQGSGKKNLNHITCFKCKQMGHYSNQCTEKSTSRLQ
jgi:hypothetical protein